MNNKGTERYNERSRISFLCMLALELIWIFLALYTDLFEIKHKGLIYYAVALLIACILYIVVQSIFIKYRVMINANAYRERFFCLSSFILLCFINLKVFIEPYISVSISKYYLREKPSFILHISLLFVISILALMVLYKWKGVLFSSIKGRLIPLYIFLSGLVTWSLYKPNCFEGDLYHFDAYFHSIYRVLQLQPYSDINTGVYGFYGIVLGPVIRLFGGSFEITIIVLAFLTGLVQFCYFYVLDNMVNSIWLRIVGSISIVTFAVWDRFGLYFQMFPHRILFIGFILAYIVWYKKHEKSSLIWKVFGMVICTLSLLWNIETGFAVLSAWIGSNIICYCQEYGVKCKQFWYSCLCEIIQAPIAFLLTYLIVGLYNLMVGGRFLLLQEFMFPFLGSDNSYINFLQVELPTKLSPWMPCLFLIICCIAIVLNKVIFCQEKDFKIVVLAACTIAVAVQMVYYVNRAVENALYIVLPIISIIIPWLLEYLKLCGIWEKNRFGNGILRALSGWMTAIICTISILFLVRYIPQQIENNNERNLSEFKKFAQMVEESVPPNTLGIGEGVDEIYSYLGWNTGYYGIDIPDIMISNQVCQDYLWNLVNNAESLFVNDDTLNTLSYYFGDNVWKEQVFMPQYTIVADFYYNNLNYRYYIRK